jgi:endoglucanase
MTSLSDRTRHRTWLAQLTSLPTAAGCEGRVIRWVRQWAGARRGLSLRADRAGNLVLTQNRRARRGARPLWITAHLDHPAFIVREVIDPRTVLLEFRGGVHPAYFDGAAVELLDARDRPHRATIEAVDAAAEPFRRATARLARPARGLAPGDLGRWRLNGRLPRHDGGLFYAHACDDLAAVAAALAALDLARRRPGLEHVGVLLTRAEEIGFIGAIAACRLGTVPTGTRLICLENSRSFVESPIGGGPIVRVGDKATVFEPALTNRIADLMAAHQKESPSFQWQRKLMPGGTCEATAFCTYGHASTCLCLPLGNYHNMTAIDAVLAGHAPARLGPEFISLADYHGLIEMLMVCAAQLDDAASPAPLRRRLDSLMAAHGRLIGLRS